MFFCHGIAQHPPPSVFLCSHTIYLSILEYHIHVFSNTLFMPQVIDTQHHVDGKIHIFRWRAVIQPHTLNQLLNSKSWRPLLPPSLFLEGHISGQCWGQTPPLNMLWKVFVWCKYWTIIYCQHQANNSFFPHTYIKKFQFNIYTVYINRKYLNIYKISYIYKYV